MLWPVYHGVHGLLTLRQLARSYRTIGKDLTRVMNRLKAAIAVGHSLWAAPSYAPRDREGWVNKLPQAGVRRRAELLYQQRMDCRPCDERCEGSFWRRAGTESGETAAPDSCIGPIRAGLLIALMQTPYRFRSKPTMEL